MSERIDVAKIEPALSAEEWKRAVESANPDVRASWPMQAAFGLYSDRYGHAADIDDPHAVIALLNAALPDGDPRKITRARIASLRQAARFVENGRLSTHWSESDNPWVQIGDDLRTLADALASYLPPETP